MIILDHELQQGCLQFPNRWLGPYIPEERIEDMMISNQTCACVFIQQKERLKQFSTSYQIFGRVEEL